MIKTRQPIQEIKIHDGSVAEHALDQSISFGEILQIWIMSYGTWIGFSVGVHVIFLLVFSVVSLRGDIPLHDEVIIKVSNQEQAKKLIVDEPEPVFTPEDFKPEDDAEDDLNHLVNNPMDDLPPNDNDTMSRFDLAKEGFYDTTGIGPGAGPQGSDNYRKKGRLNQDGSGTSPDKMVMAGLLWLARHQNPNGSWGAISFQHQCQGSQCSGTGSTEYDIGLTGLALLAFTGAGYTPFSQDVYGEDKVNFGQVVRRAVRFLLKIQNDEGVFGSVTSGKFMYNQAVATYALTDLYGLTAHTPAGMMFKSEAQKAVDYLVKAQNPGQAWRYQPRDGDNDVSVMGWCVMALKTAEGAGLKVPRAAFTDMKAYLDEVTDEVYGTVGYVSKGGRAIRQREQNINVAYQDSLTAVGIMARIFIDGDTKDERIKKGADLLIRSLPVWDTETYGKLDYYYWFYASYALYQYDGPNGSCWNAWNKKMKDVLLASQNNLESACEYGSWDAIGRWCDEAGRVYATAINVLTLEVYYRLGIVTRTSK